MGLAELAEGMLAYSHQCNYIRLDTTLTKAVGRPLPFTEKSNRRSSVPRSMENLARLFLKLFGVDARGVFKNKKAKFDDQGFMLTSYDYLARMIGFSRRTVIAHMAAFKKAGIVTVRQDINEDGSFGPIWIRINPWALLEYAKATLLKGAEKIGLKKSPSPEANICSLLSSDKQPQKSAPAVADSDAAQKKEITPKEGVIPVSGNNESIPGFEQKVREVILQTETGKVLKTLEAVFPDASQASTEKLEKIHRLVTQGVPASRLSVPMAERLVAIMENRPEVLPQFEHIDNEKNGFDVLLEYWPGIRHDVLQDKLEMHDQDCFNTRSMIQEIEHRLDAPVNETTMDVLWDADRGQFALLRFVDLLRNNGPKACIQHMSEYVRSYLTQRPVIYSIFRKRFPQVVRHCNVSETFNDKLLRQARMETAQAQTWDNVKSRYGFEHDLTVFERSIIPQS